MENKWGCMMLIIQNVRGPAKYKSKRTCKIQYTECKRTCKIQNVREPAKYKMQEDLQNTKYKM